MNSKTGRALLAFIMAFMMFSILLHPAFVEVQASWTGDTEPPLSLAAGTIVRVDSDTELASVATSGSGTSSSPYVIEGLVIDAAGHGNGIYVGNTTKYLIIRDCSVVGAASLVGSDHADGAGISLYNVRNCIVEDNDCNRCNHGISLYASHGNTVAGNNCSANTNNGIYLYTSSDNLIRKNRCLDNYYGMYLYYQSDHNLIYGNLLAGNNGASSAYSPTHVQAYDSCANYWNSTSYGNLWADWTTPDQDGDGMVDAPYAVNGGSNTDRHPLHIDLNISSPSLSISTAASSITVSGSAIDGSGIAVITWLNAASGLSGVCSGTSSWIAGVPLVSGANKIIVTLAGYAGLEFSDEVTVVCDNRAPTIEISPQGDGVDVHSSFVITFSEPMDPQVVNICIAGVEGTVTWSDNTATYSSPSLAYNKEYTLLVTGRDAAGNVIERSSTFNTTKVGDIEGVLVDEKSNMLYNTTVSLSNGLMTNSDAFGRFVLKNVTAGSYTLTVVKDGYENITSEVTVSPGETTNLGELTVSTSSPSEVRASPGPDDTPLIIIVVIVIAAIAALGLLYLKKRR